MGTTFLLDLDEILIAAGVTVIEEDNWEFRSRTSGGYDGLPTHVMWHHTASGPGSDGQPDVNFICYLSPIKPLANLYIDRQGNVWICAGGATNTNGFGEDTWGGGVPRDSMNYYAISIELANNGVGEHYTLNQHRAIRKIAPALSKAYNIPVNNHRAHFEWAPDRKIDPSGPPTPWADPLDRNKWDMNLFRFEIAIALTTPVEPPPTPPSTGEIDMIAIDYRPGKPDWTAMMITGTQLAHVYNGYADQVYRNAGVRRVVVNDKQLDGLIASSQTTTPAPPEFSDARKAEWEKRRAS